MRLQIFDVEHGACALLTADNGAHMMIDCGHNASTGWRPGTYLKAMQIHRLEQLTITNYDEDHASGACDLFSKVFVEWIFRNTSVSPGLIRHLKSEDGMGPGIECLVKQLEGPFSGTSSGTPPSFPGVEVSYFWNPFPSFLDENNLSLVLFLKCCGIGFMFPGDMECAGFEALLGNRDFRVALGMTNVFVAPHHGRESGCYEELVPYLPNVFYVVISDKGYMHETQKTIPFYSRVAKGGPFRGRQRQVVTTRNDGTISFYIDAAGWMPI